MKLPLSRIRQQISLPYVVIGVGIIALVIAIALIAWRMKPIVYTTPAAYDGYTLISPTKSNNIYLINTNGSIVHRWHTDAYPALDTQLLESGQLLRTYTTENQHFDVGGTGGGIQLVDWDGSVAWDYQISSADAVQHHSAIALPDGHIMAIVWRSIPKQQAIEAGFKPASIDKACACIWSDEIVEINPATDQVVWRWRAIDHLVQQHDESKQNYGLVAEQPRKIDANYNKYSSDADWLHTNSVDYDPDSDQIMISPREMNELWIIDHSTTSSEAATDKGGIYGHGGDLLYRFGNPEAYDHGTVSDRQFFLQHDPQWITTGLDGAGHVLMFNNGDKNGAQTFSSVLELKLPQTNNGNYQLGSDSGFAPADITWRYEPRDDDQFFSQYMGGAQRLPNGNTLVTDSMAGRVIQVTPGGSIAWSYTNRYTDESKDDIQLFRAYSYPLDYPGLLANQ